MRIGITFHDVYHGLTPREAFDLAWDYAETQPSHTDSTADLSGFVL